jgi:superfamily II DNA or RNA helicase
MHKLRDYQDIVHQETSSRLLNGQTSLIVVSPTGSGKSALITHCIAHEIVRNKRVLFLSHRRELVHNIIKISKNTLHVSYNKVHSKLFICNVSSFKTLSRDLNLNPSNINTIIIDEAHHVLSPTYEKVLSLYKENGCNIIGYTATPKRLDNKPLSYIFTDIIQTDTLANLTKKEWLCPYKLYKSDESLEVFNDVKSDKKDYKEDDVLIKIKNYISHECVLNHCKSIENFKAIGFAPNVEYAEDINKFFNQNGVKSAVITAKTPKKNRDFLMHCFEKGLLKCLWNVELFTEGIDVPDCNVLLNLRLTKSIVLWHQIIGRVLRLHPSKDIAHVFDFTKNWNDLPLPDNIIWNLDEYIEDKKDKRINEPREITFKDYLTVNNIVLNLTYSENILTQKHKDEIDLWIKIAKDTKHDKEWVLSKFKNLPNFIGLNDIINDYIGNKLDSKLKVSFLSFTGRK